MVNELKLSGRLVRDPEVKTLPSGTQAVLFILAVNRRYKGKDGKWQEQSYFFDVEAYGAIGETVKSTFKKGSPVLIDGFIKQDKDRKVKIVVNKISSDHSISPKEQSNKPNSSPKSQPKSGSKAPEEKKDIPKLRQPRFPISEEDIEF